MFTTSVKQTYKDEEEFLFTLRNIRHQMAEKMAHARARYYAIERSFQLQNTFVKSTKEWQILLFPISLILPCPYFTRPSVSRFPACPGASDPTLFSSLVVNEYCTTQIFFPPIESYSEGIN